MNTADMTAKIAAGQGFIAALDQSGGSTPKALKGYGIEEGAWSNDEEMFGLIHDMRSRIIRSKAFSGDRVIGAILFERGRSLFGRDRRMCERRDGKRGRQKQQAGGERAIGFLHRCSPSLFF